MKRSDISDREALGVCWGYGEPSGPGGLSVLVGRGYPQKVAEAKLEQLVDRGWLDYGVSIGCPWRTPAGEAALAALQPPVPVPPPNLGIPESHTTTLSRLRCRLVGHDMRPPKRFGAPRIVYRCQRCGHEASFGYTVEGPRPRDPSKPEKRG